MFVIRIGQSTPKKANFCYSKFPAMRLVLSILFIAILFSCNNKSDSNNGNITLGQYFYYGDTGVQTAGIKMIPITTPVGNFRVWTKRIGSNPKIKVLLLHG